MEEQIKVKKNKLKLLIVAVVIVTVIVLTVTVIVPNAKVSKQIKVIKDTPIGETIEFGTYEQDETSSGKEKIEWIILTKEEDKALLVSKYVLDAYNYGDTSTGDIYWQNSSIRDWLSNSFYNEAFSNSEKSLIIDTEVTYLLDPNDQYDKVFLLSEDEVKGYFSTDDSRKCKPTSYAVSNGVTVDENGYCLWWYKNPDWSKNLAGWVDYTGEAVYRTGEFINDSNLGVRVAIWVNLKH